jgi:hypothetical protein
MKNNRLQLIVKAAKIVQSEKKSFSGLERQAIQLSDLDYVKTDKKVVDSVSELDFN